jgi:carboxynorspermidine decarboxylase
MDRGYSERLNLARVATPCFIVDENRVRNNLAVLDGVQKRTGCRILLALKAFAMFSLFPLISKTLKGVCASSPHEARLGREEFGGEVHTFAAGYSEADMDELIALADHIIFNSFSQWQRFRPRVAQSGRDLRCGIRINPEHSEAAVALYDPCAPQSRLGVRYEDFVGRDLTGISGLHLHTLCEQNADALARTLEVFESRFGPYLHDLDWLNLGGGHHITRADYDLELLCDRIMHFRQTYGLEVYLEPGEAVVLNAGILVASVLDIVRNELDIAILDASAVAHMPDVIEMPYRPEVAGGGRPGALAHTYRLAGHSCLAGDVIGDYSFATPLKVGDRVAFLDMAHYTMVKTTTFNGLQLPAIAVCREETDTLQIVRRFGYEDFKNRLS